MVPGRVNLVVEDSLSESICRQILGHFSLEAGYVYGKEGVGFIKTRLRGFNHAAKGVRYFVLADLDQSNCPPDLWKHWVGDVSRHPNLLFRVAVREVESWLLADVENLERFLFIKHQRSIPNPDQLADPKRELLRLALKSPKKILRDGVVFTSEHGELVQGPDYNGTLQRFVFGKWDIQNAIRRSESLRRATHAVRSLKGT